MEIVDRVLLIQDRLTEYTSADGGFPANEAFALAVLESALAQILNKHGSYTGVSVTECLRFANEIANEDNNTPELLETVKLLRASIRHATGCRGPYAAPCSCDAERLWDVSAIAIAQAEGTLA
jgi:hypothetical protein